MGFADIFKKSFIEGFGSTEMGFKEVLFALLITAFIALYIFLIYRVVTRRTFYSKNFNISLAVLSVIIAGIILTIQFSIVISLGMVGALSIVRFRTAVKDPMDLVFLFWSISVGIICGAGLAEVAVVMSLIITAGIFLLDKFPSVRAPMLLVINADRTVRMEELISKVEQHSRYHKVKARNVTADNLNMVIELRTDRGNEVVEAIVSMEQIKSVSLMEHDGEVTC